MIRSNRIPFITILRPPALVTEYADAAPLTPPLGPAYLAGSLRHAGFEVRILDAIGEAPRQVQKVFEGKAMAVGLLPAEMVGSLDLNTNIVGITCTFSHDWPLIRQTIRMARERFPNALIVAGGEHVTALPEFVLDDCPELDIAVSGEGEEIFIDLVRTWTKDQALESVPGIFFRKLGQVKSTGRRARIRDIDSIPLPAWDLTPLEKYLRLGLSYGVNLGRTVPMMSTRGCPYQCTFCSSPSMWTTKWSARDPGMVLDEIEQYMKKYQATNFDFYDLTMIIRKDWILKFTQMIQERNLRFTWQLPSGTRSEVIDGEVSRALYQTGCRNISYAPESGSPEELIRIKKRVHIGKMLGSMKVAVHEGLNIKANIIIGFPGETRKDILLTMKLLWNMARVGVQDMAVSMFSAYPGSELYSELRNKKLISKLTDEYFISLNTYKDLISGINWSGKIGSREFVLYRLMGYGIFYGFGYLFRPLRLLRTCLNLLRHKEESRLEKSLTDFFRRRADIKRSSQDLTKKAA